MMRSVPAALGLRFEGLPVTPWLALSGAEHWPLVTCQQQSEVGSEPQLDLKNAQALIPRLADPLDLAHPIITTVAQLAAWERQLDSLHAGGLCGDAGAWLILGPSGAGKSTLLAACGLAGLSVLSDDVTVLNRDRCLAGPRCVDLLADAAGNHPASAISRSSIRKHRVTLPPIAAEHPLAGFVHLQWGLKLGLEHITAADAMRRLLAHYKESGGVSHSPVRVLDFAERPTFVLTRPRDPSLLSRVVELLRDRLALI